MASLNFAWWTTRRGHLARGRAWDAEVREESPGDWLARVYVRRGDDAWTHMRLVPMASEAEAKTWAEAAVRRLLEVTRG